MSYGDCVGGRVELLTGYLSVSRTDPLLSSVITHSYSGRLPSKEKYPRVVRRFTYKVLLNKTIYNVKGILYKVFYIINI